MEQMHISWAEKNAFFLSLILLFITDYVAVIFSESLAYFLRRDVLPLTAYGFYIPPLYFFVVVPTIFLCFLYAEKTHLQNTPFWKMAQGVFHAVLYSLLTIVMLMYFGKVAEVISRLYVGMVGLFSFFFILSFRYALKRFLGICNFLQMPVVFIGAGKTAELLLKSFHQDTGFGYRVLGFIDDHPASLQIPLRFPILGSLKEAEDIIRRLGVQTVIIAVPGMPAANMVALINRIQPLVKHVDFVPDIIGTPMGNLEVESLLDEKIMMLKVRNNLASPRNRFIKRVFDIVVSFLGLGIVVPLGVILAVVIFLDSPGRIIFAHRRIGQQGKEFPCYKFRSMVPDAQQVLQQYLAEHPEAKAEWDREFKLKDDPRITRVGAFLRRTSLDELPQLFNVLKGEMSLVGPRPIVREEIAKYGDYIHDFYLVPPGITGMWQVSGRSDTTYDERVQMDSWYVRNWSVWIDMMYLVKTLKVVVQGRGAY